MANHTNFASYNMTLDDIDQSEIEQMMRQIEWEQTMNQATIADPEYDTTSFDPTLSPLSGYASPSSMTTGSTNQSPLVPLLDYDMTYPMVPSSDDPASLFPELMDYNTNMDPAWLGSQPEDFTSPLLPSYDDQAKLPSTYPLESQLYMTAALTQTTYINNPPPTTCPPRSQPQAPPTPSSSQPSTTLQTPATTSTTTDDLTCLHCGATFTDKTKLKVHTNKHTKPFQCTAPACTYAAAEKKSLHRHLQGKSDYDVEHRAAARRMRVPLVKHRCPRDGEGCTYTTFRDDNLKRHNKTCTGR